MPNEYLVIYLDESSKLTQEELIEILRRTETGKIVRLSCVPSSVLSEEEV